MKRLAVALLLGLCFGATAHAQSDDAAEQTPESTEKADAAKAEGEAEAPPEEKAADAEPTGETSAGPGLKSTTVPGANIGQTPANPPADDLPAWTDAPVTPGGNSGSVKVSEVNWDTATTLDPEVSFPWIEHHGYFRIRADLFHNLDLDTYDPEAGLGTSPVLPPLTELDVGGSGHPEDEATGNNETNSYKRGAESLSSANMRFRYQPTIHIAETMRIKSTIDVMDNVVLGSTPDGGWSTGFQRPDVPLVAFSGGQRPVEGPTSHQDSVRIKQLWGEWTTPLGLLLFGRVPSHWGLGILANNGHCHDCDFGDNVDRIMGVTKLFDTYIALAWDFPSEGFVGHSGDKGQHDYINQPAGQAHDFDQRDDVNEYVIALFDRPLTQKEKETRERELNELRKPVFDWGVYNVIRSQKLVGLSSNPGQPRTNPLGEKLFDVEAFAYIPDLWMNFEYRPRRDSFYKLQFEAVAILGSIDELPQRAGRAKVECQDPDFNDPDRIQDCPDDQQYRPRKRDLQQWAYAIEFDHRVDKLQWGLKHGVASGDSTPGFGVYDKLAFQNDPTNPDDTDQEVTNFKFDRDYTIDLILFRELIGTVTNAAYFKPYLRYDLIRTDRDAWGFEIAPLYAFALEESSTPGLDRQLGLEFDLEFYVIEFDRFKWSLQYGILFPFAAFNYLDQEAIQKGTKPEVLGEPGIAQTIQASVLMHF